MTIFLRIYSLFTRRITFGTWLDKEEFRQDVVETLKLDAENAYEPLVKYVAKTLILPVRWIFTRCYWEWSVYLFSIALMKSYIRVDIPLTQIKAKNIRNDAIAWDYKGRTRFYLVHLIAEAYGWTVREIENLSVKVALPIIQEILVSEQMEKEFQWSLSEIAYPYNKTTKKSEFKPMPRPYWMNKELPKLKTFKIPKSMLPVGVVNDVSGMSEYVDRITNETKETKT